MSADRDGTLQALGSKWSLGEAYLSAFAEGELAVHLHYLERLEKDPSGIYSSRSHGRRLKVHGFDTELARAEMCRGALPCPRRFSIASGGSPVPFMVVSTRSEDSGEAAGDKEPTGFFFEADPDGKRVVVGQSGIALSTLARNMFETFSARGVFPYFMELSERPSLVKRGRNFFSCEFHFASALTSDQGSGLEADLRRYLQTNLRPMSIFDIIGPSMVGPSSSHTAGACRIGQVSRNLLEALKRGGAFGRIDSVRIRLLGSFRDTGVGHGTPSALAGGLKGHAPDDPGLMEAGDPARLRSFGVEIGGDDAAFGGFTTGTAEEDAAFSADNSSNIAEVTASTDRGEFTVSGFSIGGGNVEVRYLNGRKLSSPLTGGEKATLRSLLGEGFPEEEVAPLRQTGGRAAGELHTDFNTFEEIEEHCGRTGKGLLEVALDTETGLRGTPREAIYEQMARFYGIMKEGVEKGLRNYMPTPFGLTGGDSGKMARYAGKNERFGNIYGKAAAYATAVNEMNAKSCLIVAAPTAGSCGILPGVMKAYEEEAGTEEKRILEAMMVAGFFGMVLFNDVSTAGADYGCQAEVGAAAAITAAAVAYLEGGDASQTVQAFTLAIKNCMGLVCDPVAGLVEVPCVKRNGIYTSVALTSAMMALSGVRSFVSPDEVVLAVREVGEKLNRDYKETARGGLAGTRDGQRVALEFSKEVKKFFVE